MSLPSYLISGASSRAHHAFLVKLHRAGSKQAEDEVIQQEIQRVKQEFGAKGAGDLVCHLPLSGSRLYVEAASKMRLIVCHG
jgi:hypothetical protein